MKLPAVLRMSFKMPRRFWSPAAFFMIHRPERLADAIEFMRRYKLEPKHIQLVYPKADRRPSMFLTAGVKCGGRNLVIDKPLVLMKENGEETEDLRRIYEY
jgi:tRNA1Val (adenine37-N6)-methyltransferase